MVMGYDGNVLHFTYSFGPDSVNFIGIRSESD